jgi:hypothetical protein
MNPGASVVLVTFGLIVLSVVYRVVTVVRMIEKIRIALAQWNAMPEADRAALTQQLSAMSWRRQARLADSYMPLREEMANIAGRNGIDAGFLYRSS